MLAIVVILILLVVGMCLLLWQKNKDLRAALSRSKVVQITSFTASVKYARKGEVFKIMWETNNAEQVRISRLGNVASSGVAEISVEHDTLFMLSARNGENNKDASLYVKLITKAPVIRYQLLAFEPAIKEYIPLNAPDEFPDNFSVLKGQHIAFRWKVDMAEEVRVNMVGEVEEEGEHTFLLNDSASINIMAQLGSFVSRKTVFIHVVPTPILEKIPLPLPENTEMATHFNFREVIVPSSFILNLDTAPLQKDLSVLIPSLQALEQKLQGKIPVAEAMAKRYDIPSIAIQNLVEQGATMEEVEEVVREYLARKKG